MNIENYDEPDSTFDNPVENEYWPIPEDLVNAPSDYDDYENDDDDDDATTIRGDDDRSAEIELRLNLETSRRNGGGHCFVCDADFGDNNKLLRLHLLEVHRGARLYTCYHCGYESPWKSNLKKHIEHRHLMMRNLLCPYCGYRFFENSQITRHLMSPLGCR